MQAQEGAAAGERMETGKEERMEDRDSKAMHQDLPEIYIGLLDRRGFEAEEVDGTGVHGEKRSRRYEAKLFYRPFG